MRRISLISLLAVLIAPMNANGLERTSVPMTRADQSGWDAAASCSITYANICTGWLWVWSQWAPREIFGVVFDPCCATGRLVSTQAYFWTGAPSGWGYTGTIAVSDGSGGCVGTEYDSRICLPHAGPRVDTWDDVPPGPIALTQTNGLNASDGNYGYTIPTDHPSAGPTGPPACGYCYASTRTIHTFRFGTVDAMLCPGSPLNDGVCDAEALKWSALFACVVPVEPSSWGRVKNLYRE